MQIPRIYQVIYSKLAELALIGLLLVFIYPFSLVISGIVACLALGLMYRGFGLFRSLPGTIMIPMIRLTSTVWSVAPYDTFKAATLFLLYFL